MVRKQRRHLFFAGHQGFNSLGPIDDAASGPDNGREWDIQGRFPSDQFVLVLNLSNPQRMKST